VSTRLKVGPPGNEEARENLKGVKIEIAMKANLAL
jgi:hypothetical protein